MDTWAVVLNIVLVISLVAWSLIHLATRIDRAHFRVEGAVLALDGQLVRRAEAAMALAHLSLLDPASNVLLLTAALDALETADATEVDGEVTEYSLPTARIEAEETLTETLRNTLGNPSAELAAEEAFVRLASAHTRVHIAVMIHNQGVREVLRLRRSIVAQTLHLAGNTALPNPLDFDDQVPALDLRNG